MDKVTRKRRWFYGLNFLLVIAAHVWMLSDHHWDIIALYTVHQYHPWWLVLMLFLHLLWGVHNLFEFINYRVDDTPEDTEKTDE